MSSRVNKELLSNVNVGDLSPYLSPFHYEEEGNYAGVLPTEMRETGSKLCNNLKEVIEQTGLKDGDTISFHHHFRNGDMTIELVLNEIRKLGIKNLRVASSSLTQSHACIIDFIEHGTIDRLETSGCRGELAEAVSRGVLKTPMIIRSHGGRAAAIESGRLKIDVAFLAVSSSDEYGNANGTGGRAKCGSLGYAMVDAKYADKVVLLTDTIKAFPNTPVSIPSTQVDFVVEVSEVGDPSGIATGATRITKNPKELLQAKKVVEVIKYTDYFRDGFVFQTGSGGASLAVTRFLKEEMEDKNIQASLGLGGITKGFVDLLEAGLFKNLTDTQSFDMNAIDSIAKSNLHMEISAAQYASPFNKGCTVNKLDYVVLSALEIDVDFNVNVITGSDGVIRGASGGHSDTAAGAKCAIIVAPLVRGRIPTVVDSVQTVITPGETIDVFVCEYGIAVNPRRTDLAQQLTKNGIELKSIDELRDLAYSYTGKPKAIDYEDEVVALIEYRDGSIIDVVRKVK